MTLRRNIFRRGSLKITLMWRRWERPNHGEHADGGDAQDLNLVGRSAKMP